MKKVHLKAYVKNNSKFRFHTRYPFCTTLVEKELRDEPEK